MLFDDLDYILNDTGRADDLAKVFIFPDSIDSGWESTSLAE